MPLLLTCAIHATTTLEHLRSKSPPRPTPIAASCHHVQLLADLWRTSSWHEISMLRLYQPRALVQTGRRDPSMYGKSSPFPGRPAQSCSTFPAHCLARSTPQHCQHTVGCLPPLVHTSFRTRRINRQTRRPLLTLQRLRARPLPGSNWCHRLCPCKFQARQMPTTTLCIHLAQCLPSGMERPFG